ncbi:hypothetical protein KFK14_10760 [Sphingobium phenoxybenzoativorans]|uniref:Uncharacterized protein n=1 Tax=Sphingobium phenoxybenzoativorans TaxID=1592790 RepID=A0A975Q3U5_9SPHN|nr:hypothetical protein [Sphingobium phenoxybenzoativorans]QUT07813.1 hypothetical protein KFK14_10760 [Sphingobium phenoxybenzoativorans]
MFALTGWTDDLQRAECRPYKGKSNTGIIPNPTASETAYPLEVLPRANALPIMRARSGGVRLPDISAPTACLKIYKALPARFFSKRLGKLPRLITKKVQRNAFTKFRGQSPRFPFLKQPVLAAPF